jgi:hypothetical protein
LSKPRGDDPPFEEEKAWLDAELAGGGNEKEVDANGEEVKVMLLSITSTTQKTVLNVNVVSPTIPS